MTAMAGTEAQRRMHSRRIVATRRTVILLVLLCPWLGWARPDVSESASGTVILVGDVLRFNQRNVWNRITENATDLAIVAAASERPKLYGEFARRALQRHGAFSELLPLAVDPAEFAIDYAYAVADPAVVDGVRDASGVFFVGGAPQRLSRVLFRADGSPTPLRKAIVELHAAGGVVVGGIPGSAGLFTGVDAMEVLARGHVSSTEIHRGLDLVSKGWFVDQHAFSPGRLAEILVAMHQLEMPYGIGVGNDTAAVIEDSELEVVGDGGVLLIDLSESSTGSGSTAGFRLAGARLSYLEHGDRFDMSTLEVRPTAEKLDGFELEYTGESSRSTEQAPPLAVDFFARGQLLRLMREALDASRGEAFGYAFPEGTGDADRGFRFRFHAVAGTLGWLSVESGMERYTIVNMGLEISPARRKDMSNP